MADYGRPAGLCTFLTRRPPSYSLSLKGYGGIGRMQNRKSRKQSPSSTLASVKREMSKPRVVQSARRDPDTLANGGHMDIVSHAEAVTRAEAMRALLGYAKAVGI